MAQLGKLKDVQSRTGTKDKGAVSLTVKDIPIGDIHIKENIRKEYTGLEELKASIREYGLIQPITAYKEGDDFYVKTGHRRYKAFCALHQEDKENDKFHSIRCIITDAAHITVFQLIENVQRVDLSELDLFNALAALKNERMKIRQIAEIIGKSEGHITNLFTGINEILEDNALKNLITHAGVCILDVAETKGIPNRQDRLDLLEQRGKGEITRNEMRERAKSLKGGNPATKLLVSALDTPGTPDSKYSVAYNSRKTPEPSKIKVLIERHSEQKAVIVRPVNKKDGHILSIIEKDLRAYFGQQERYKVVNILVSVKS